MADNTLLNPGSAAGDTIRTIQRTSTVKTEVVQLDAGGELGPESLVGPLNPLPVAILPGPQDYAGIPYVRLSPDDDVATTAMQRAGTDAINGTALNALPPATVAVGTSSVSVVAANPGRRSLLITNTSTAGQIISLHLTGGTAVSLSGITLWPGDVWVMDRYSFVTAAISAIGSAISGAVGVQEFN